MCIWNAYMLRCLQNGRSSSRSLESEGNTGTSPANPKSHNEKAFGKGIGIVAKIEDGMQCWRIRKEKAKEAFSLENVIVFGNLDTKISKLAVVPGSGRSMISEAKSTGADVFLNGDIGHHEGLDAVDMGMCVIDAGHYGLEQVFIDDMKDLIRTYFSDMNVITYKAGSPYKVV